MPKRSAALVAFALLAPLSAAPAAEPILGFSAAEAAAQHELEARFDAHLEARNLAAWMERMAAKPHHVGSPQGKANAEFIAGLFRSWGYETRIEEFRVLFPTPRARVLELVAPEPFTASLSEPPIPGNELSQDPSGVLPPYNAYSVDGDVTAELVYVNYGIPADYEELERHGISVAGKIVIARYGASWRGIKPKVAAEKGAIGCILYSDPEDDGYFQGDVYPQGGYRPPGGVQRGSVADMPLFPGDPLTPSRGATAGAERLDRDEAPTLTKIPVLPISWTDALPLLRALGGPVAPEAWRGGLPITYHLGPGPAKVHLGLEFDWELVPAYDVIAVLEGAERPDQWIVRGNHHDAWVAGATDPVSGMVALLEEARAVGELARSGWRPRRTIVYAAWDGEEPGLLGSVEWAEAHADELREKAAVYINSDSNSRGFLRASGSHTLELFVNEVARDVPDPQTAVSAGERLRARITVEGDEEERKAIRESGLFRIDALGSGSDYTAFLDHLGIASLDLRYGGEGDYGQYHSLYDTVDHFNRFMDPGFVYGIVLAKTAGRAVLRLANAAVLPFEIEHFAATVGRYLGDLEKLAGDLREETAEERRRSEADAYRLAADPAEPFAAPAPEEPVPHLNFAPLRNAVAVLEESARRFEAARQRAAESGADLPPERQAELDRILIATERALTRSEGLPGRPWFRHHVYAPGFYTGYGVKTLPGVREALEERRWQLAETQIAVAAEVLRAFASEVDRGTELLSHRSRRSAPEAPRAASR